MASLPFGKYLPFDLRKWLTIPGPLRPLFFRPAPELQVDEDLVLRGLGPEHTDALFALIDRNRDHLRAWLSWVQNVQTPEQTRSYLTQVNYRNIFSGGWAYGIWHRGELAGLLEFNEGDAEEARVSLGYWLGAQYTGLGLITRCCRASLDYAFSRHPIHKVLIKCAAQNERSQNVARRLRFMWEGIEHAGGLLNGAPIDVVTYGMRRQDWLRVWEDAAPV
ncbi:MAG: GNAT family N-acetyltransferase [Bacteroidia bacterium]|nr:GNAT family N-acetyltransferase [Bacteroidia bacterium]